MITISAASVEFIENGNTVWVHSPLGTTLIRIKCTGKIVTQKKPSNPSTYTEMIVDGNINICLADDVDSVMSGKNVDSIMKAEWTDKKERDFVTLLFWAAKTDWKDSAFEEQYSSLDIGVRARDYTSWHSGWAKCGEVRKHAILKVVYPGSLIKAPEFATVASFDSESDREAVLNLFQSYERKLFGTEKVSDGR